MNKFFVLISFCILVTLLPLGCQEYQLSTVERPRDVWVMRSVLDGRSRMISLAMHEAGYLAYDANYCALYKVWRGGIHLNGAPFNDVKTIQPTSWGGVYSQDSLDQPVWTIRDVKRDTVIPIAFGGYSIVHNRITFRYDAEYEDKQFLKIAERPEFEFDKQGNPTLVRIFRTRDVPDDIEIKLKTQGRTVILPNNDTLHLRTPFAAIPPQQKPEFIPIGNRAGYWIARSGCLTCHERESATVGPAWEAIAARYASEEGAAEQLAQKIRSGGSGNWGKVPMNPHPHIALPELKEMASYILSLVPDTEKRASRPKKKKIAQEADATPGHGAALEAVHPAYDLSLARPLDFHPKIGGMDFLPDGRLAVCTWDSLGAVYLLDGVETGDPAQISVKRIASGLAEPLGLKVVGKTIFVLQKQELTELRDFNGDDIIDEYRAACSSFDVSPDFHEFSYGLQYLDGFFYANLGLAMRLMSHEKQLPDRGKTIELSPFDSYRTLNSGLRQPNGIGVGPEGELFITENQGKWVPACKLIHVKEHTFEGCRLALGDSMPDLKMRPPAVWLPQGEIGNSPGEPTLMRDGPYKGQMLHGEVRHGGIKRVFLEKIDGEYQGCVFRFSQGLEAGINRLVWGPDGALYAGGVGMNGGWSHKEARYGLQRMEYNGTSVFEMLAVRATPVGMEIELTEPLDVGLGEQAADYQIQQWWYLPTQQYGGPKMDLEDMTIQSIDISQDRKRIHLSIPGLKPEHVVYIRLPHTFRSQSGQSLWSSETWYTLNTIPQPADL